MQDIQIPMDYICAALCAGMFFMFYLLTGWYFVRSSVSYRKVTGYVLLLWAIQEMEGIVLSISPVKILLHHEHYMLYELTLLLMVPSCMMLLYSLFYARRVTWGLWLRHSIPFVVMDVVYAAVLLFKSEWCDTTYFVCNILSSGYVLSTAIYLARYYRHYHARLRQYYAEEEGRDVYWVLYVLAAFITLATIWGVIYFFNPTYILYMIYGVLTMSIWVFILYHIARQEPAAVGYADEEKEVEAKAEPVAESEAADHLRFAFVPELERLCAEDVCLRPQLTVDELAHLVGTNRSYLSLYLNSVVGKSFFDFVNDYRIAHALELLRTTRLSTEQIALRCGYSGAVSMRRIFQRYHGCTPSEWRMQHNRQTRDEGLGDIQ